MALYFITGNQKKAEEAREILGEIENIDLDLPEIQSLDPREVIAAKLQAAQKQHSGKFFCEDVSLELDCLQGLPGPFIKWFLRSMGTEGIVQLVEQYHNPKVTVKAHIGYTDGEMVKFFEGIVEGTIVPARVENGFGFDAIFQPEGSRKTFAEMDLQEKNSISHRRKALEKLKEFLENGDK